MDGVLFIDEAYGLLPSNALGKETDFGGAVMDMLLKYTDPSNGQPICFVCAGYERDMKAFLDYNPGLSRRFHVIRFDNYSVDELMEILGRVLEAAGYEAEPGYMEAARANFSANIRQIQDKYNGDMYPAILRLPRTGCLNGWRKPTAMGRCRRKN